MKYLNLFEDFKNQGSTLIIVDVQKSFKKFFTDEYIKQLQEYCKNFKQVYQIWDNHVDGKNVDKDYLYDSEHESDSNSDLYDFPNQVDIIEKRYNYDVNVDFYKKILDDDTYNLVKSKEKENKLNRGDFFKTTEGTIIVYIGNNHKWYHVGKPVLDLFNKLKGQTVTIVGGSQNECILDIIVSAKSLGLKVIENKDYIYSSTHCPIK
jgi:hypothetical protein